MKFWKKLVLFVIAIISIILAFSRYYIVKNNFMYSIQSTIKQNINQNTLEKYLLEGIIAKDIQEGKEISEITITEYLQSIYNDMVDNLELIAVYTEDYNNLYTNIEGISDFDVKTILTDKGDSYCLKKLNDKHFLLLCSHWSINNKILYIINAYDVEKIYEEKDRQMKQILITDIIILALSSIVICIFAILLTRPIKSLNNTTKKIAKGKYNERVKVNSNDEIGELAYSFNLMAGEIENKINDLNLSIKQKEDFINGFTHELKTPMTAIVGYADLLRLKKCDEELSRKAVNYIYQEGKRLENLSFKLMKLMSLTNENIELSKIKVENFINKIVKIENELISSQIDVEIESAYVIGDNELLEVVMKNLIENADKAEPKDLKIKITGKKTKENKYIISVIDKGIGIPKEHIERVTEDFYMVDKSRSRVNGGSGIGLSLVKKILILHNSRINIESEKGIGTTVYFELDTEEE